MKTCFKDAERRHEDISAPAPHTVLELFAGAGGMSTGLKMAGLDVVCASDSWDVAAETYRRQNESEIISLNMNYERKDNQ